MLLLLTVGACNEDDNGPSIAELYQRDTAIIDQYIADNDLTVEHDPESDIRYFVTAQGSGLAPYLVESVRLSYTGRLISTGEVVETAVSEEFDWQELFPAWRVMLNNIQEGGSMTFFMPSVYNYGEEGTANIPPAANIIYEVTLEEVKDDQLRSELAEINDYLNTHEIAAETHPSGIRYSIQEQGTGDFPNGSSYIQVAYEGKLLGEDTNFDSSSGANFQLGNLIPGWQIALPLIQEGGSITLYIPGTLGYGSKGNGQAIPPDSNLEFHIELQRVQ